MSTKPYMPTPPPPSARDSLAALLECGPLDSQAALGSLTTAGFTPKQIRGARERIGVVVSRHGFGKDARSSWALPLAAGPVGRTGGEVDEIAAVAKAPRTSVGVVVSREPRRMRRVEFFVRAGMHAADADALATLCEKRDIDASRLVSCAECQNSTRREWCGQVRPFIEMHDCEFARRHAP